MMKRGFVSGAWKVGSVEWGVWSGEWGVGSGKICLELSNLLRRRGVRRNREVLEVTSVFVKAVF